MSANAIVHDLLGDTIVTGSFSGIANFSTNATPITLKSIGQADIYVAKYAPDGDLLWAKALPGASGYSSVGNALALTPAGDIYVTGSFQGKVDFDPGAGRFQLDAGGSSDAFVVKLTGDGNFTWATNVSGAGWNQANGIAIDPTGTVAVVGSFKGSVDFDPGPGAATRTSFGNNDAFVWEMSSSGQFVNALQFGGKADDLGNGISVDGAGDLFITGSLKGPGDFNPGPATTTLTTAGNCDVFVVKLDNAGRLQWAKTIGGASDDIGRKIAVDQSGDVFVAGTFKGTADFDPSSNIRNLVSAGNTDAFAAMLDANGTLVWAKDFGGPSDDTVGGLNVDAANHVFLAGSFQNTAHLGSTVQRTSAGSSDIFAAELDSLGNTLWARAAGGSGSDRATALAVGDNGTIDVAGSFEKTANFSPGGASLPLDSQGTSASFLWKLDDTGTVLAAHAYGTPGSVLPPVTMTGFRITGLPSATAPGVAQSFIVQAVDANGNLFTNYRGTVSFTSSDLAAVLPAGYTFSAADNGQHTFSATFKTSGSQTLAMRDQANAALTASVSEKVDSVIVVPPPPASRLNPNLPPSGNFNLSNWNITLPTGSAEHPTIIPTSSLLTGYTSPYFHTGTDGAMVFWAPVTGVTTSGSSYPRSELRETKSDGSLYNWNVSAGTATLAATLAVNQVPSTGKVVIGQIHDDGSGGISGQPLIKLVYEYDSATGTGSIVAQVRPTPPSSTNVDYTIASNIKLNSPFSYQIQLKADLNLSVQINGVTQYSQPIDPSWKTQGMYFKAGSYVQDNVGPATEGAQVSFYALTTNHAPLTTGPAS